jgi:hypothetical protein
VYLGPKQKAQVMVARCDFIGILIFLSGLNAGLCNIHVIDVAESTIDAPSSSDALSAWLG